MRDRQYTCTCTLYMYMYEGRKEQGVRPTHAMCTQRMHAHVHEGSTVDHANMLTSCGIGNSVNIMMMS